MLPAQGIPNAAERRGQRQLAFFFAGQSRAAKLPLTPQREEGWDTVGMNGTEMDLGLAWRSQGNVILLRERLFCIIFDSFCLIFASYPFWFLHFHPGQFGCWTPTSDSSKPSSQIGDFLLVFPAPAYQWWPSPSLVPLLSSSVIISWFENASSLSHSRLHVSYLLFTHSCRSL